MDAGITGYQINVITGVQTGIIPDNELEWSNIVDSHAATTSETLLALRSRIEHNISLRAVSADGPSSSSHAIAIPKPAPPNIVMTDSRTQSVLLVWEDPEDPGVKRYQVRHAASGTRLPDWGDVPDIGDSTTTMHTVGGLTKFTVYEFEVRAKAGRKGQFAGAASRVTEWPVAPWPTNLSGRVADGKVVLTWDAPDTDPEFIRGYQVLRRLAGDDPPLAFRVIASPIGAAATTYTDTDVAAGRSYTYRVRTVYDTDVSQASNDAHVGVPMLPAAPDSLTVTPGDRRVTFTWLDPGDDTIERYQWRARSHFTPLFGVWRDIDGSESTTNNTLATRVNGFWLAYELRARNPAGTGEASLAKTLIGPPPSGLAARGGVTGR